MAKINRDNLGYLGFDYQLRLMVQILTDRKFANSIIDIVDPNYFEDPYLRIIAATIKDAKAKDDIIPDVGSLEFRLLEDVKDDVQRRFVLTQLRKIQDANLNDTLKVQDIAMKFCKQQELKKSIKEIQKIIDKGDLENYDQCEVILRKALEHGDNKDDGTDVFDNIAEVLVADYRKPIRTGIKGLDEVMDGGLAKGELAVILAGTGVGKTSMTTKLANTAATDGYKVLQIIFEDTEKVIKRKHLSCWSGYELNDLSLHSEELLDMCDKMETKIIKNKGLLRIKKFSSYETTMPIIKKYIRKMIAQGNKPDLVLLDYIDCVQASRHYDDANIAEGSVMRQLEAMTSELDLATWVATQGNRTTAKGGVVETDQIGGSYKKAQIGHFILSISKTMDQRDAKTATMAILKSRFGDDGIVFNDIIFNNSTVQIDMTEGNSIGKTRTETKKLLGDKDQERINAVFSNRARIKDTE